MQEQKIKVKITKRMGNRKRQTAEAIKAAKKETAFAKSSTIALPHHVKCVW